MSEELKSTHRLVPLHPEPARLESMCLRYDHSHGIKMPWFGPGGQFSQQESDEQFEQRRESNRRTMRQIYEEAVGEGFYRENKELQDLDFHTIVELAKKVQNGPMLEIANAFEITFASAVIAEYKRVNGL